MIDILEDISGSKSPRSRFYVNDHGDFETIQVNQVLAKY